MKFSYLKDQADDYILQENEGKIIIGEGSSGNFFLMFK
jgi:hypothetical protein